jgi:hypothetical protein
VLWSPRDQADLGGTGTAPAGQLSSSAVRPRWRGAPLWWAGFLLAGVALFWCYLRTSQTIPVDSDGAANALQAWDMLHGNLLLHGWYLSDVSFYTTELPEYMLVDVVRGLGSDVVHVSAALTYTLLVLLAAFVARGRESGGAGLARAALAAGILLAPQLGNGAYALLLSPDHTGTAVPILALLVLLDWARPRWWVPVAALVLLAWTQVGDSLATIAAAAPLAVVCAIRAIASKVRGRPLAESWYDIALAASAVLSVLLARAALDLVRAAGGFRLYPLPGPLLSHPSAIPHQAVLLTDSVLELFGAQLTGQPSTLAVWLAVVHLAGVALVAVALLVGLYGFFSRLDRVSQFLVAGTVITLAAGLFGTHVTKSYDAHEIAVVLPFGAALAGRLLGPWLLGVRRAGAGQADGGGERPGARWVRVGLRAALAVVLAGYLVSVAYNVSRPARATPVRSVAAWLAAHGLRYGLGDYWQAQSTTLATGGVVTVAPLSAGPPIRGVYPYLWETKQAWVDPHSTYANFVVSEPGPPWQPVYGQLDAVRSFFGTPAHTYHVGGFTVLVWNYNILTRLAKAHIPG